MKILYAIKNWKMPRATVFFTNILLQIYSHDVVKLSIWGKKSLQFCFKQNSSINCLEIRLWQTRVSISNELILILKSTMKVPLGMNIQQPIYRRFWWVAFEVHHH